MWCAGLLTRRRGLGNMNVLEDAIKKAIGEHHEFGYTIAINDDSGLAYLELHSKVKI